MIRTALSEGRYTSRHVDSTAAPKRYRSGHYRSGRLHHGLGGELLNVASSLTGELVFLYCPDRGEGDSGGKYGKGPNVTSWNLRLEPILRCAVFMGASVLVGGDLRLPIGSPPPPMRAPKFGTGSRPSSVAHRSS